MFSLDGSVKYWLYNKPVDMRKSFNGLSGIVTNGMCASLRSGDVYIFMNAVVFHRVCPEPVPR